MKFIQCYYCNLPVDTIMVPDSQYPEISLPQATCPYCKVKYLTSALYNRDTGAITNIEMAIAVITISDNAQLRLSFMYTKHGMIQSDIHNTIKDRTIMLLKSENLYHLPLSKLIKRMKTYIVFS